MHRNLQAQATARIPTLDDFNGIPFRRQLVSAGFVRTTIVLIGAAVLGMTSLIFYRSITVHDPTAAIVVSGNASMDGANVVVRGEGRKIAEVTLSADNAFKTPVLLEPGDYNVTVVRGKQMILDRNFSLDDMKMINFDLTGTHAAAGDMPR